MIQEAGLGSRARCRAIRKRRAGTPAAAVLSVLVVVAVFLAMAPAHAADPVVESVTWAKRPYQNVTVVDVTFTISDADGDDLWIYMWGHDEGYEATIRHFIPMCSFVEGDVHGRTWGPGTHTVSWIASLDRGSTGLTLASFQVYMRVSDHGRCAPGRFLVIDATAGSEAPSFNVDFLKYYQVAYAGQNAEGEIVLRELPDGSWIGVHEVTYCNYLKVMGSVDYSCWGGYAHCFVAAAEVSWNDLTGSGTYASGYIATLRAKTGIAAIDLPTSAEWEYACRAGTVHDYSDYRANDGLGTDHPAVLIDTAIWRDGNREGADGFGNYIPRLQPNVWGLYNMMGNVSEWVRDSSEYTVRGGNYGNYASQCTSDFGLVYTRSNRSCAVGFRLFIPASANLP